MFQHCLRNKLQLAALLGLHALYAGCAAEVAEPDDELEATSEALKSQLPVIPEGLGVPAGNKLAFVLDGVGAQIYDCKAAADGGASWVFRAPEAELFRHGRLAGTHYAGPTWEGLDGSTVVGARVSGVTVDASAIPWLLLKGTGSGKGRMGKVTYLQRLETVGGLAPSSGCDATTVGAVADVEYSALYVFYEAQHGCK
jgi:hypothetical protein